MVSDIDLGWLIIGIVGSLFGGLSGALYQFVLIGSRLSTPVPVNKKLFFAHVFVSLFIGSISQIAIIVFGSEITFINVTKEKATVIAVLLSFLGAEFVEKIARKKAGID